MGALASPGRSRRVLMAALLAAAVSSCNKNQPPELLPIDPQVAYVGSRFELRLVAADAEGDRIVFSFSSPSADIQDRARMSQLGGEGVFSWTPLASDVGEQQIDFVASDGGSSDMESVLITVKPSTTGDTTPVFRKPLGEGTT